MTKQDKTPMTADAQGAMPIHKNIASALAMAQSEMGKALKSANNPHFRSKYADLSSVADACMPSLTRHGIAVIQPTFDDETGRYVKTILIHGESGEMLECRVPLIVQKNDMQGYGSAVTYARRYGLMGMAGIAPDDDDGNAAAAAKPADKPEPPKTVTPGQFVKLRDRAEVAGVTEGKICAAYDAPSFEQFPADAYERAMNRLQATIDAKEAQENDDLDGDSIPEGM